jgi:hypothetical protein
VQGHIFIAKMRFRAAVLSPRSDGYFRRCVTCTLLDASTFSIGAPHRNFTPLRDHKAKKERNDREFLVEIFTETP